MGKSAGQAPNYQGAAQQQAQSGQQAVQAQTQQNRPNIQTPFSFQNWTTGPDGTPQLSTGFGGGLGAGADSLANQAGSALGQGLDPSLFGPAMTGDAARNQAIGASYDAATSRLDPTWDRRESMERTQLANQGLDPNSEAYRNQTAATGRDRNDAYTQAMRSAIDSGTSAGSAVFGQNLSAHQQGITDALTQRNAPLSELQQLQGLTQTPQFNTAGAWDPTQYLQAAMGQGNYQLQDAQQQNQVLGSAMQGLFSMAGSAAKFSDARLKQAIVRLPVEALPGVPFASWEWKHEPGARHVGVIAQDLEKVAPQYVSRGPGGFRVVDYSFLGLRAHGCK